MTVSRRVEAHRIHTESLVKAAGDGQTLVLSLIGFSDNGKPVKFDASATDTGNDDGWRPWLCPESGRHYSSFNVHAR